MKYIRTKDEVGILVENNNDIKDKYGDYLKKGCYFKTWFSPNTNRDDVIKQADTIEELCDKFVYKKGLYNKIEKGKDLENQIKIRLFGISFFDLYIEEWKDIYGAIWTEWGLKYVAKMNEKGELELL